MKLKMWVGYYLKNIKNSILLQFSNKINLNEIFISTKIEFEVNMLKKKSYYADCKIVSSMLYNVSIII